MPELRIDPIVGRKVLVAENRDGRPFDYVRVDEDPASSPSSASRCCFCHDREDETPPAVAESVDEDGRWNVRVVPNKYPALTMAASIDDAFGAHEVVIESPNHDRNWMDLSIDQVGAILRIHRDRLRHWASDGRMRYGMVFKNSGFAAGASLEHVHSQLMATSTPLDVVQAELDACRLHLKQTGARLFDELIEQETSVGERIVMRTDRHVALCAYAGRQPYETWILPDRPTARFEQSDDQTLDSLAPLMHAVLSGMHECMPHLSYNLVLHTGPFDGTEDDSYRWHWEILPRRAQLAGIEIGGGLFINSVAPERAAEALRASIERVDSLQSANPASSAVR